MRAFTDPMVLPFSGTASTLYASSHLLIARAESGVVRVRGRIVSGPRFCSALAWLWNYEVAVQKVTA